MIQRKVRSIKNEKIYPTLPYSTGEMFDLLEKGHLQELYNVNFYSIKGTLKLNHAGYAEIESKHLATKVWSICNDWEALLFPRKYSRQLVTGFTIHRLTALKDVIQTLHKMNCTDITQQNKIWADVAVSQKAVTKNLLKNIAAYVTIENNDGVQETITGKGITHDTNITLFQPLCNGS